jgi:uncharacterized protein (TIGR02147 family)
VNIFEYEDYKVFVNDWVKMQPRGGYGVYSEIARRLGTNSVTVSQTFKGPRSLSLDHAAKLSQFMGLGRPECDFFLVLVQKEKAATAELKAILHRQLVAQRSSSQAIKNQIKHEQLTDVDKATFYSSWHYVAVWLAAASPAGASARQIAERLRLPEKTVIEAVGFLVEKGLLLKAKNGFEFGQNVIHVPHDSIFAGKHHLNWRMKAIQSLDRNDDANLHYTAPVSLSAKLAVKIRAELVRQVAAWTKQIAAAPSEELMCLNIDWFQI